MLKAKVAGLAVAGLLLSAGTVYAAESAFPGNADEGSNELARKSTYTSPYHGAMGTDAVNAAQSAIAGNADEGSRELAPLTTYADEYRAMLGERAASMVADPGVTSAFPVSNSLD